MSEALKSISLASLALRVHEKADSFTRSWSGEELATQLRARLAQLQNISARAKRISDQFTVVAKADSTVKLPRRRLNPRIKTLLKLESVVALDIRKVVEADAIDKSGLDESLKDTEQVLLDAWQKFSRPPKEALGIDALADVPELRQTASQLRTARQQLEAKSKELPSDETEVTDILKLQKQLLDLGHQIRTKGYPDEVIAFLSQVRAGRGVALGDVLKNPTLRAWLETDRNANALRVVHESVLNQGTSFRL